jgi:hypothetical protein
MRATIVRMAGALLGANEEAVYELLFHYLLIAHQKTIFSTNYIIKSMRAPSPFALPRTA